ncbi:MAG: hypothetical protein N2439_06705, partial [Anaerolineae bacterium]|nr:hypothetical protein [Anaerolineae bacterium]
MRMTLFVFGCVLLAAGVLAACYPTAVVAPPVGGERAVHAVASAVAPTPAAAAPTVAVSGVVMSAAGGPLGGALVQVWGAATRTQAGADGVFALSGIAA